MTKIHKSKTDDLSLTPCVLVTGASSGIGYSSAILLSKNGFFVYAGVRTKSDKDKLESAGNGKIKALQLDVTKEADITNAANMIKKNGSIALVALVNSAGICKTGLLEYCNRNELVEIFNINAASILALSNKFLPLLQQNKGKIINIESTSSQIPNVFNGAYCISKAALEMLGNIMRIEYSVKGISVVSVRPGVVATPFWKKIAIEEKLNPKKFYASSSLRNKKFENRQNFLKSATKTGCSTPEDVASVVHNIITSKHPGFKYVVGRDAKIRLLLYKFMPHRLYLYLAKRKL